MRRRLAGKFRPSIDQIQYSSASADLFCNETLTEKTSLYEDSADILNLSGPVNILKLDEISSAR